MESSNTILDTIKKQWKNVLIGVLAIILLFSVKTCSDKNSTIKQNESNLKNIDLKNQKFKEIIREDSTALYMQGQIILSSKAEIKEYIEKVEQLSKINQQIQAKVEFKIKEVPVFISNPIYIKDSVENEYLKVPADFNKSHKWYSIHGQIREQGIIQFDSLSFNSELTVSMGLKKRTFKEQFLQFKKREAVITYSDKNPYARTKALSNFKVEENKASRFGIGISSGYSITPMGLTPYLGVGVHYTIIQF